MLTRLFLAPRPALPRPLTSSPLHTTPILGMPMPTKRRKRADPQVAAMREQRRIKRVTKALAKMSKRSRIPRPISECEVLPQLRQQLDERRRPSDAGSEAEQEAERELRARNAKDWARFCNERHKNELWQMDTVLASQKLALLELRAVSEDLYRRAIAFDDGLLPFKASGPTHTPKKGLEAGSEAEAADAYLQDGEYEDVTKRYEVQYADMDQFMTQLLQKKRKPKKKVEDEE